MATGVKCRVITDFVVRVPSIVPDLNERWEEQWRDNEIRAMTNDSSMSESQHGENAARP